MKSKATGKTDSVECIEIWFLDSENHISRRGLYGEIKRRGGRILSVKEKVKNSYWISIEFENLSKFGYFKEALGISKGYNMANDISFMGKTDRRVEKIRVA